MPCPTRRQLLFAPVLLWTPQAKADLLSTHPATRSVPEAQGGLIQGTYLGQWTDGQELRQILRVIGPDMITLQRQGYSSPPVPYQRVARDRFQNSTGNSLIVLADTRLSWTSSRGVIVTYELEGTGFNPRP